MDICGCVICQYKVRMQGRGLVMASLWDVGSEDTEDKQPCYIVAERHILKKTLERTQARIFQMPRGINIDIVYEEPQRVADSDQLRYLPSKTINARDLRGRGVFS